MIEKSLGIVDMIVLAITFYGLGIILLLFALFPPSHSEDNAFMTRHAILLKAMKVI